MPENVLDLLTADHRDVEELVQQLLVEPDAARRREPADTVIAQLVRHAVAEETILYPAMELRLEDGAEAVEHDKAEHKQLERVMRDMEGTETGGPEFYELVGRLQTVLADHIKDEEQGQFPLLREKLDGTVLTAMGAAVEALKKVAPTRPHPDAPQSALFHLTVGPGVGLVDRLRDALSSTTKPFPAS